MKFLIETGSENHTTSSASCQAKFVGGGRDGEFLYQNKSAVVSTDWHMIQGGKHGRWVTTVYDLPAGTEIEIIGKGRTGARGADKWEFHRIYRLDESADVQDFTVDVGLRNCTVKSRLVFVRDLVKKAEDSLKASQEEGF
jgi:hypothetical protein